MNNTLLLKAAKWLNELGIKTEAAQTYLKINRVDVKEFFGAGEADKDPGFELNKELKIAISNKVFLTVGDSTYYHLNSF